MIQVRGTLEGNPIEDLGKVEAGVVRAGRKGMENGLRVIQEISRRNYLQGPRPARLGIRTGRLFGSINVGIESESDSRVVGFAESDTPYSKYHEYGFRGQRKGKKRSYFVDYGGRPFLITAIQDASSAVANEIQAELEAWQP